MAGVHNHGMHLQLKALVTRLGGPWLLRIQPRVVTICLQGMGNDKLCHAVTAFLKAMLSTSGPGHKSSRPQSPAESPWNGLLWPL